MNRFSFKASAPTLASLAICAFSSVSVASGVYYNMTGFPPSWVDRDTLPTKWLPATGAPGKDAYKGSLDVHWYVGVDSNNESLEVSKTSAIDQGAPANYDLITLEPNCWGMNMNFGLIKLGQAADVTITVSANESQMTPWFALYQGWDTGSGASRHDIISLISGNNPLGTIGLTHLGATKKNSTSTTISNTFTGLAAGNYELFTTISDNNNSGGAFKVTVKTTQAHYNLTVKKPINGTIKSPALNIDCGTSSDHCQALVLEGEQVTLSAISDPGIPFLGWTEPASCVGQPASACTFTMTEHTPVSAIFAEIPPGHAAVTLGKQGQGRIVSTPAGIDCGDDCTSTFATYPVGTTVTLKATANTGHSFAGWSGDCTGTGDCALTLDVEKSVKSVVGKFSLPGQCGTANNQPYSTAPTSAAELCAVGEPGSVTAMKHSRFNWLCTGGSLAERCYTLGNNNKQNQAPLILSPGSQKVTVGQKKPIQHASGGSGNGAIQYKRSVSKGTKCRLVPQGKKVRVFVRGEPGVCKITATKVRSRKYNEVESAPVTLTVTR